MYNTTLNTTASNQKSNFDNSIPSGQYNPRQQSHQTPLPKTNNLEPSTINRFQSDFMSQSIDTTSQA